MLWAVLACVAILPTTGTPRILLDVSHPEYLKCMAALVCKSPPLSYILFPCSGLCWHALPFFLLLETIGTTWNSQDSPGCAPPPVPEIYGCTGVQVPPLSYILFPCSGLCWHALPFFLLVETIGTTWNLYDPRILLDVPCPPVPEMYGCTDVQVPPFNYDKQKTRSWCWGVDSWGRRILRTMDWWRKVNLCNTLWIRLLKASNTIRL